MRELLVMLLVDEADDVVEDENALDRVAHRLVLRLEPVDDHARAQVDQLVRPFGVLDEVDHEVRRAADEAGGAQRAAARDHRQDVTRVENALPVHAGSGAASAP